MAARTKPERKEVARPDAVPLRLVRDPRYVDTSRNKGWNRISIIFWSRQPYRPNVSADDFRLPSGGFTLRTLATCLLCGVAITLGYIWFVLFFVSILAGLELGPWFFAIMGGSPFVIGTILFVLARGRRNRERKLTAEF
jgi:hypothetical protein